VGGPTFRVLDGIGDGAFLATSPIGGPDDGPNATVVLYKGPPTVQVSVAFDSNRKPMPSDHVVALAFPAVGPL